MRTLLYIFSLHNAIKREKDLLSFKRNASCAMAKNNLVKRFATSARVKVAQLALQIAECPSLKLAILILYFFKMSPSSPSYESMTE